MTVRPWWDLSRQPATRPIPRMPAKPAAFTTGYQYYAKGVPAGEQATYWELARAFRGGDLYAFSWDAKRKCWETWATEADWLATERNGVTARPDLAAQGHGPRPFVPRPVVKSARATKAECVSMLRRMLDGADWEVSELEELLARS